MDPEIKRYLDAHGTTYTPEALRRGLLEAGYDPAEVDAALLTWHAPAANPATTVSDGRRFWPWASYQPVAYSPIFTTRIELDASPDGRSGTLSFEGLEPFLLDRPPGDTGLEPISGTVTWKCT